MKKTGLCFYINGLIPRSADIAGRAIKKDRIKAIYREKDGIVLLYKRLTGSGSYKWPRNQDEVKSLTWKQFEWLMDGLEIEQPKAIKTTGNH